MNQVREPTERELKRGELKQKIAKSYHESFGTYGSPRVHDNLIENCYGVSEKTVVCLMNERELCASLPKKFMTTTDSDHNYNIYPNLLDQNFEIDEPNKVWMTDITYIWTLEDGFT